MSRPVHVVDYDPRWPASFELIRAPVALALGLLALRIEHVGSTSVPGLAAKPIIDLDVVIGSRADLPAVIAKLGSLGCLPRGDLGVPGREAFNDPPGLPKHHLYVCSADNPELARHLAFRDYLRGHPEAARGYASLMRSLAIRFRDDRDAYTEAKTAFVEQVLAASAAEAVAQGGPRHEIEPMSYPAQTEGGPAMTDDTKAMRPEDVTRLVAERLNAGDAAGAAALYEPQAVLAYPADRPVTGRDAIQAIYQRLADAGMMFAIETPLPTVTFEDLALTSTRSADNTGVRVQVLRRQPDGSWLRIIDRPEVPAS